MTKHYASFPRTPEKLSGFAWGSIKATSLHKFIDMRVFAIEDGKDPAPTKKGLAVSPALWPQFRQALVQAEAAMVQHGWLDKEDLEVQGE